MVDKTLTKQLLRKRSSNGLIKNMSEDCLNGASYDFRVGKEYVIAGPSRDENAEHRFITDKENNNIEIEPGYAYTFYSFEKVNLPKSIQGRLSLRSHLANKKIFFSGGLIDPGYSGRLFFTIFNLGTGPIEIKHKQAIVTGEFTEFDDVPTPRGYDDEEVEQIPRDKLPDLPSQQRMRNWTEVNQDLDDTLDSTKDISNEIKSIREKIVDLEKEQSQTRSLIQNLVLAAIAGIFAGVTIQILNILFF